MANVQSSQSSATSNPSVIDTDPTVDARGNSPDVAQHRAAALALSPADVRPFRVDARLAMDNALRGRDAIVKVRAAVEATGYQLDWEGLATLDSLCRAVLHTADRTAANPRITGELLTLLREGRKLRKLLLSNARFHVLAGQCPADEVKRIAKGTGPVDAAKDLVDLAILHNAHPIMNTNGGTPPERLARALELGTQLRERLQPSGAAPVSRRTESQREAANLRDRLFTLLVRSYDPIERAGGAVWGPKLRDHIPALPTRHVARKRAKATVADDKPTT